MNYISTKMAPLVARQDIYLSAEQAQALCLHHFNELQHEMFINDHLVKDEADGQFFYNPTRTVVEAFSFEDGDIISVWKDYKGKAIGVLAERCTEQPFEVYRIQFRQLVPLATQFLPED
jgi:hypothetical protein